MVTSVRLLLRKKQVWPVAVVFLVENQINDEEVSRGADDAPDRVPAALSLKFKFESQFQSQ